MNSKSNTFINNVLIVCGYLLVTLGILSLLAKIIVKF